MQQSGSQTATVSVSSDRAFLWRLCISAWLFRLLIIVLYALTDAIERFNLSLDHRRYDNEGIWVMNAMNYGDFALKSWIDDGWFQFVGLIYFLLWPSPVLIQLINITLSVVTVIPLFLMIRELTADVRVQRFYAILIAFFPSIMFWSTLMLKDPAAILAVALVIYGVFVLRQRFSLWPLLGLLAGLVIFIGTRTYLFIVIVMLMPAAFLLFPAGKRQIPWRIIILPALIGLLPMAIGYGYFASGEFQQSMYFDIDYINAVRGSMSTGSGALFDDGGHTWGRGIGSDIWLAVTTLFAIFVPVNPFELANVRQLAALPFVLVMFYLFPFLVRGVRYLWAQRSLTTPIMIFATGVLAVYIGGTSNTGALFRWTAQVMPYFLLAISFAAFARRRSILARFATWSVLAFSRPRRIAVAY
jgi:hypothetical protein